MIRLAAFDGRALLMCLFIGGWTAYWCLHTRPKKGEPDHVAAHDRTYQGRFQARTTPRSETNETPPT